MSRIEPRFDERRRSVVMLSASIPRHAGGAVLSGSSVPREYHGVARTMNGLVSGLDFGQAADAGRARPLQTDGPILLPAQCRCWGGQKWPPLRMYSPARVAMHLMIVIIRSYHSLGWRPGAGIGPPPSSMRPQSPGWKPTGRGDRLAIPITARGGPVRHQEGP